MAFGDSSQVYTKYDQSSAEYQLQDELWGHMPDLSQI